MNDYIKGYHATGFKKAESILKTQSFDLKLIKEKTLKIDNNDPTFMPGDLGGGAYFFIKNDKFFLEPKQLASKYYMFNKFHTYQEKCRILEAEIRIKDSDGIDFREEYNQKFFDTFRNRNENRIKSIFNKKIKNSRSKSRMMYDGLATELLIIDLQKSKQIKIDYVIKDSYTRIDESYSLHDNGTEISIRNQNNIININ